MDFEDDGRRLINFNSTAESMTYLVKSCSSFLFPVWVVALMVSGGFGFVGPAASKALVIEGLLRSVQQRSSSDTNSISISAALALGMTQFNSPYILGGDALRDKLTCNACHDPSGLSGAASNLTLSKPLPDFFHLGQAEAPGSEEIASFIRAALPREFQSHDVPDDVISGLSIYLADWRTAGVDQTSNQVRLLHVGPWAMARVGVTLAKRAICSHDTHRADLLIETVRFGLGEIHDQTLASDSTSQVSAMQLNRRLHVADDALLGRNLRGAYEELTLAEQELQTRISDGPTIVLLPEEEHNHPSGRSVERAGFSPIPEELRVVCKIYD
jgi:hypothetical protein